MSSDKISSYVRVCVCLVVVPAILVLLTGCPGTTSAYREPPGAGRATPATEGAPTVVAVSPVSATYVFQGQTVAITWIDSDPDDNAAITVFYDEDGQAGTADDVILHITDEDTDGPGDQFLWNTMGVPWGTYWIGVTIDDGVNPPVTDYAMGFVAITVQQTLEINLRDVGTGAFSATLWRGWNSGDLAGSSMDGGMDVDGDGIDDMVIVARHGNPFLLDWGFYGEAYLIFGQHGRFDHVEELNSVSAIPPGATRGTIFAAPIPWGGWAYGYGQTDNHSNGIVSVAMIPNSETLAEDGVSGAEIAFGLTFIEGTFDEVDYDPLNSPDINNPTSIAIPITFTYLAPTGDGGVEEITITRNLPVSGCTGYYLDYNPVWPFDHTYTYTDVWTETRPEGDPPVSVTRYHTRNYQIRVQALLPFVVTDPGDPFLQLNLPNDGELTAGGTGNDSLSTIVAASAYPLNMPTYNFSDDSEPDYIQTTSGMTIVVSSRGSAPAGAGPGFLEDLVILLSEVGQEGPLPQAHQATYAHGVRFRPDYSYNYQDEVDNMWAWNPPSWLVQNSLVPSDYGQSISYADMNGEDGCELLIGAPRMAHSWGSPWSYSFLPDSRPRYLYSKYTGSGATVTIGSELIAGGVDFHAEGVKLDDWVHITNAPKVRNIPSAILSNIYRVYSINGNTLILSMNPIRPGAPSVVSPVSYNIFGPSDAARTHMNETGGISVIYSRLGQVPIAGTSGQAAYEVTWWDFARDNDRTPYPSWPNCRAPTPSRSFTVPPVLLDGVPADAPAVDRNYSSREWLYPWMVHILADFQDAGPEQVPPNLPPQRNTNGGQLGYSVTGLAAVYPATGVIVQRSGINSDFNSDGLDDLASGAPFADPYDPAHPGSRLMDAGLAYVVYGRHPFGTFDVTRIANPLPEQHLPGLELMGRAGDRLGFANARIAVYRPATDTVVDFNGDGIGDWLVGAPGRDPSGRLNAGAVAVVFGHSPIRPIDGAFHFDRINTDVNGPPQPDGSTGSDGVLDEWDLNAAIFIGQQPGDELGTYVAGVGDVNADGYADILISAPLADGINGPNSGKVYLIYGSPNLWGTYDLRDLGTPALPGKTYHSPSQDMEMGPVARAGDIDNDGFDDYLIGNPNATQPPNRFEAGECYLIYGTPANVP